MNIIIEGPDCAGKTTLAKVISDGDSGRFMEDWRYFHNGLHEDPFYTYLDQAVEALKHPERNHIWDRFWPSNIIYSPIMGGKMLTLGEVHVLRTMCEHLNVVLLMCLPPWEGVKSLWKTAHEEEYVKDEETMHRIYNAFASARFGLSDLVIDPIITPVEDILERVKRFQSERPG